MNIQKTIKKPPVTNFRAKKNVYETLYFVEETSFYKKKY